MKNIKPALTIGLPFYNSAATLADAVRSVFSQTFQNWELILMDDGSTDRSLEIARSIRDSRVTVHSDGVNRGLVFRLNQIAQLSNSIYLARMDSDDLMHPLRLEKQLQYLMNNNQIDLVDCAVYSIDRDSNPEGIRGMEPIDPRQGAVLRHALLIHAAVVGRTTWFRQNPYNHLFVRAEDRELWCRTYKNSSFDRIQEPLYFVREGLVNLQGYLKGLQTLRYIFKTYGPEQVGNRETAKLILESYLKSLAYKLFSSFGAHDFLARKRNMPLSKQDRDEANKIINVIINTRVPGF